MFFLYRTCRKTAEEKDFNKVAPPRLHTPTPVRARAQSARRAGLQLRVHVRQTPLSPSVRRTALCRSPSHKEPRSHGWPLHLLTKLMHQGAEGGLLQCWLPPTGPPWWTCHSCTPSAFFSSPRVNYDSHSRRQPNYTCGESHCCAFWLLSSDGCRGSAPFSFTSPGVANFSAADMDELPLCAVQDLLRSSWTQMWMSGIWTTRWFPVEEGRCMDRSEEMFLNCYRRHSCAVVTTSCVFRKIKAKFQKVQQSTVAFCRCFKSNQIKSTLFI